MYTLDTNAILYYLKDDNDAVIALRDVFAQNSPVYVSAVTELELLAFGNLSGDEQSLSESLLATVAIIPVDSHVARIAALLKRQYRIKVPDSIIAASEMFTRSTLLTRNRDFRKISNLSMRKL